MSAFKSNETLDFGKGLRVKRNVFGARKNAHELWAILRLYVQTRGKNKFLRIADTLRGVESKTVRLGASVIPKYILESSVALDIEPQRGQIADPQQFARPPPPVSKDAVYQLALHTTLLPFPFGGDNAGKEGAEGAEGESGKKGVFSMFKKKDENLLDTAEVAMTKVPFAVATEILRQRMTAHTIGDFRRRVKSDLYRLHKEPNVSAEDNMLIKCLAWLYDSILIKAAHGLEGRRIYDLAKAFKRKVKEAAPKDSDRKSAKKHCYRYFESVILEVAEGENKIDRTASENLAWAGSGAIEPTNLAEWVRSVLHYPTLEHRRTILAMQEGLLPCAIEDIGKRINNLQTSAARASQFTSPEEFADFLKNEIGRYQELRNMCTQELEEKERLIKEEIDRKNKAKSKKAREAAEAREAKEREEERQRYEAEAAKFPPPSRLKVTVEKVSSLSIRPQGPTSGVYCVVEINKDTQVHTTETITDLDNSWWNASYSLYGVHVERIKLSVWNKNETSPDEPVFVGVAYINAPDEIRKMTTAKTHELSLTLSLANVDHPAEVAIGEVYVNIELMPVHMPTLNRHGSLHRSPAVVAPEETETDEDGGPAKVSAEAVQAANEAFNNALPPGHDASDHYRLLMQKCLEYDTQMHLGKSGDMTLSRMSEALLYIFGARWGVSEAARLLSQIEFLIPKYMNKEISLSAMYEIFQSLAYGMQSKSYICTKDETQRMQNILLYLEKVFRFKAMHYRDEFPANTPAKELDQMLAMLCVINGHPLYRTNNPNAMPWNVELSTLVKVGAIERAKSLNTLASAAPNVEEYVRLLELTRAIETEFTNESKFFAATFERHRVNNVELAVGTYLNYFKLDVEQYAKICASESNVGTLPVDNGASFALLDSVRALHAKLAKYPSLQSTLELTHWFAPFVYGFLKQTLDKANMVVQNSIKLDDFEPVSDSVLHSSSVIDTFAFFHQTYDFLKKLNWPSQAQYAKFIYQMSKIYCTSITTFVGILQCNLGDVHKEITVGGRKEVIDLIHFSMTYVNRGDDDDDEVKAKLYEDAVKASKKFCVKLNDIEAARSQLSDLQNSVQIDDLQDALNSPSSPKSPLSPAGDVGLSGNFELRVMGAESLMGVDSGGLSNPFVVIRHDATELCQTRVKKQMLNPVWTEAFDIGIRGYNELVVEVHHKGPLLRGNQLIGKGALELTDSHGDFDTHELAVDLQPQGRLLLRLKKVGDQAGDIEFQFRRCFRALKRILSDTLAVFIDPMAPIIQGHISKVVSMYEQRPVRESLLWYKYSSDQNLNIVDNELATELSGLFSWLGDQLGYLSTHLYEDITKMLIKKLWREVLLGMERMLIPSVGHPEPGRRPLSLKQVTVLLNVMEMLKTFMYGDGDLLTLSHLESPDYHRICHIIELYQEPSDDLMELYMKHVNPKGFSLSRCGSFMSTYSGEGGASAPASAGISRAASGADLEGGAGGLMAALDNAFDKRSLGREWRAKSKTSGSGGYEYILNILRMRGSAEQTFVEEQVKQRWERVKLRSQAV
ncbi:hypothetical protein RI367_005396 [Sorochytrium milnesiophthora]